MAPGSYGMYSRDAAFGKNIMDLSQGMNMSYTEMLLSIDNLSPPLSQGYLQNNNSAMIEPMGSENHTFMITGRYKSSTSFLEGEDLEEDDEHHNFGDNDDQDDSGDKFDDWQWEDNGEQTDEPIFDNEDHIPEASNISEEQAVGKSGEKDDEIHQASDGSPEVEMHDGVEQLTADDIRIFMENESIAAAFHSGRCWPPCSTTEYVLCHR